MIEELRGIDPDVMTDGEVMELAVGLRRVMETAEAASLRTVGTFGARKLHATDGARSAGAWLASHTDLSRHEANSLDRHARMVRSDPLLAMAVDRLGATKVRTVLRYVAFRSIDTFRAAEATILEEIAKLDVDGTAMVMRWWARQTDMDGREPKWWDGNELDLKTTFEGGWMDRGSWDPESGAELAAALDAEAEAMFREGGTDGERLALGKRRAMALLSIIRRNLDPEHADTHVPPTVVVSTTLDQLMKDSGQADLIGTREKISSATLRRLLCDANVIRLIRDSDSEIIDLGRSVRTAPLKFWQALAVRDRGCVFPGCDAPPTRCQAHHILWWDRDHGDTSLSNLALLCHHHHHLVHEGRWRFTRAPDNQFQFHRPDGTPFSLDRPRSSSSPARGSPFP